MSCVLCVRLLYETGFESNFIKLVWDIWLSGNSPECLLLNVLLFSETRLVFCGINFYSVFDQKSYVSNDFDKTTKIHWL